MSDQITESPPKLQPPDCPQFNQCNAPICPLDPRWSSGAHLPGEKVCHYLLSSGKTGAAEYFAGDPVYAECRIALPLVCENHRDIAKRVEIAAKSGFKGRHLRVSMGSDV